MIQQTVSIGVCRVKGVLNHHYRTGLDTTHIAVAITVDIVKRDQTLRINSIEQRFRYAAWDDPLLTTRGWEADISLRHAGSFLGGNTDFHKVVTSGEFGYPNDPKAFGVRY